MAHSFASEGCHVGACVIETLGCLWLLEIYCVFWMISMPRCHPIKGQGPHLDSYELSLILSVIPPAPRDIYVKLMDSHSALVSWSTSAHPWQDDLMTSFYVEYKVTDDEQVLLKVVRNHNSTSLSGLKSHAEYQIRVRAVNGAGGGFWSQYYTFSTGKTCKLTC